MHFKNCWPTDSNKMGFLQTFMKKKALLTGIFVNPEWQKIFSCIFKAEAKRESESKEQKRIKMKRSKSSKQKLSNFSKSGGSNFPSCTVGLGGSEIKRPQNSIDSKSTKFWKFCNRDYWQSCAVNFKCAKCWQDARRDKESILKLNDEVIKSKQIRNRWTLFVWRTFCHPSFGAIFGLSENLLFPWENEWAKSVTEKRRMELELSQGEKVLAQTFQMYLPVMS